MKKLKRGLALLLTALMLISALPATVMAAELEDETAPTQEQVSVEPKDGTASAEEQITVDDTMADTTENDVIAEDDKPEDADPDAGISTLGYQHIETKDLGTVDLTDYLEEELKAVELSKLLPGVDLKNISAAAVDTSSNGNGDGQYEVIKTENGTIDLSGLLGRSSYSSTNPYITRTLEIINSDDQLDTDAIRYIVRVQIPYVTDLLSLYAYNGQTELTDWSRYILSYTLDTDLPVWDIKNVTISMGLNPQASKITAGLTAKVYEGTYRTADDVDAGKEITDDIWGQDSSGYTTDWTIDQEFTIVLERNGKVAQVINITVWMIDKYVEFDFDASTVATDDKPAEKIDIYSGKYSSNNKDYYYVTPQSYDTWQSGEATLKFRYKSAEYFGDTDYSDYTDKTDTTVYTGYYEDETALNAAVLAGTSKDITADIWAADGKGYTADYTDWENMPTFTVVVKEKDSGDTAYVAPFYVSMDAQYDNPVQIGVGDTLYVENPSSSTSGTSSWNRASEKHTPDWENGTDYYTMRYTTTQEVNEGHNYPTDGKYYVQFYVYGGSNNNRESLAEIDRIEDKNGNNVKDAMLGSYGYNYYQVDFSEQPVTFTVYFKDKLNEAGGTAESVEPQVIRLRTLPAQPSEVANTRSTDTYFNVTGVDGFDTYTMPYHVDSSYQNGFQVLFVDATKEELEASKITITYNTGSGVRMFYDHNEHGDLIETQNKLTTEFTSGKPILFSAASESGTHLRNYWVTLIAKGTEGPKLWVNGQDDPYHTDKDGTPMREVYLYGSSSYYDIFFANIGDEALEDLTVTLSANANIRLDDYWSIGDTKTLAPFTAIEPADQYSELENIAKIRIWPKDSASKGDIDATLTISAKDQDPVSIKLTGKVGQAAIVSSSVPDGVKFVPYSVLIQTNFQSTSGNASNRPTFKIVGGVLPTGLDINDKTGEIYGVPKVWSNTPFNFTVGISQGGQQVDSRSFTMHVAENTDDNVWNSSDPTYEVQHHIGNIIKTDETNDNPYHFVIDLKNSEILDSEREDLRTFVSYGPYIYHRTVFLDGKELILGVDYTHEEGSDKIVLSENTISRNNTNGNHTLAIEFREGNNRNYDEAYTIMKRTAQNYTIEGGVNPSTPTPQPPSSGDSSGGGSSSGNDSSSNNNNNQKPSTPSGKTFPFVDVRTGDWHYNDVYWVWDQGLMTGVSSTTFAPDTQISQAMIVVTLAHLANINLTSYENVSVDGAALGAWYTTAAAWAQQTGILPDYTTFDGENGAYSRDGMAIMLVKYLASMGVDTAVGKDIAFDDMDQMTDAGRDAFRVLCHYGIFVGVGDNKMDPGGVTTRAQFAALVHRTSDFVVSR